VSGAVLERPAGRADGGVPARRAMIRWGWRLLRREWRQQLLVLGMLAVAVAATIFGAGVATNTPPEDPNAAAFGSALALVTLPGSDPHLAADIAAVQARYGPADVIENQDLTTGTVQSVELRAQDPRSRYGGPLLALVSGGYPAGPGQVAMTSQVAALYGTGTGGTWHEGGKTWRVTGIVENPSNLLDEFALVTPGQVTAPSQVTMLLGSPAAGQAISSANQANQPQQALPGLPRAATVSVAGPVAGNGIPPGEVVVLVAVLGLVFIGLVSVAGFTVLAQRRLRALGMLAAIGATERNVRLVLVANGAAAGVAAAAIGAAAGFAAWFAYIPSLQADTGHVVDGASLPWWAISTGIVLAIITSVIAAAQPARAVARIPVVAALSGRPAAPRAARRSFIPGAVLLGGGAACLAFSGGWTHSNMLLLLAGLTAFILGMLLLVPAFITVLAAGAGPRVPVAVRIALRDLLRYRTRSAAALAATTFAVFLAMLICLIASVRFSNVLDWTGPNLAGNQLIISAQGPGSAGATTPAQLNSLRKQVNGLAAELHAQSVVPLETVGIGLAQAGPGAGYFTGQVFVATPQLLAAYGIKPSQINPGTYILTMRPGLASLPGMQMSWWNGNNPPPGCTLRGDCLASPKMQQAGRLPGGTDAPNTVITEWAVTRLHLHPVLQSWLIQAPSPVTAAQANSARRIALGYGVTEETKSSQLSMSQIAGGATALGIIIAIGVLAMTTGLIRAETARDLRTLTATGASPATRRTITAATAGALGLLGAATGMAGAVIAGLAWARSSLTVTFGDIPPTDILILLIGLPLAAAIGGWLLAGREPAVISRQPLE